MPCKIVLNTVSFQGRYLAPAAMQQHPAVSMAAQHHTAMASSHHDPNNGSPAGVMSPTSPTSQPQIIYHPAQHPQVGLTHMSPTAPSSGGPRQGS